MDPKNSNSNINPNSCKQNRRQSIKFAVPTIDWNGATSVCIKNKS